MQNKGVTASDTAEDADAQGVDLSRFSTGGFGRGRSALVEALWQIAQALFLRSFVPGSAHRRLLLRLFGAKIGRGVVIKPGVRVKFPWRLSVGSHSWIGEDVWIDNLATVTIGQNCCLSQGAYLCTGSHDWSRTSFDLVVKPIHLHDNVWIAARATVAPGAVAEEGAVLALGGMAAGRLAAWHIHGGVPARPLQPRKIIGGSASSERPAQQPPLPEDQLRIVDS